MYGEEDDTKIDFSKTGCEGKNWIKLAYNCV